MNGWAIIGASPAPAGAASSTGQPDDVAPTELWFLLNAKLQICRAYGAGIYSRMRALISPA